MNQALRLFALFAIIFCGYTGTAQVTASFTTSATTGCAPLLFTVADESTTSTMGATITYHSITVYAEPSYSVTGSSTVSPANFVIPAGGNYLVVDSVVNSLGQSSIDTQYEVFTIGRVHPVFSVALSADSVCPHTIFTVTGNCSNCTSFTWNFNAPSFPPGSGETLYDGPSFDTTYEYSAPGLYRLQGVGNDSGCQDTEWTSIYVLSPSVGISYSVLNCSSPYIISFTSAGSTGATGYFWAFGDGTISTVANPTHVYTPGIAGTTYIVILVDSGGGVHNCHSTDSVVLNLYPIIDTFHASDTFACKGQAITFTASRTLYGTDYANYAWLWGDGSEISTTANITSHAYINSGYPPVTLIITNSLGCSDTLVKYSYLTIAGPIGVPTANGVILDTGCAPLYVNFSDNDTDFGGLVINRRHWNFNAPPAVSAPGAPANAFVAGVAADTSVVFPEGYYTIILIDSDNMGCLSIDTMHVYAVQPHAYFYTPDSTVIACIGTPIPFFDSNTHCTYSWQFGDGATGTGQNPVHVYTANGVYSVTVTITSLAGGTYMAGCSDSYTSAHNITIGNIPVNLSLSDTYSVCAPLVGFASNLTTPVGSDVLTYQWRVTPSGAIVSTSSLGYLYELIEGGTVYDITLIATSAVTGCKDSLTKTASIQGPAGYIHYSSDSGCVPYIATLCFVDTNSTAPATFNWEPGDGSPVINTSDSCITHTYSFAGTYHPYVLITGSGCSAIEIPSNNDSIQVFPIPTVTVTQPGMLCYGADTVLNATGAGTGGIYTWTPALGLSSTSGAVVIAGPLTNTTYTVIATSAHGCTAAAAVTTITVDTEISVSTGPSVSFCSVTSTTLTATGADSFTWSPSMGLSAATGSIITATPATTTIYTVTGSDLLGCKASAEDTVSVLSRLVLSVTPADTSVCRGSNALLIAGGEGFAGTYAWHPGYGLNDSTIPNVIANPAVTTTYNIIGTNICGTDTISVTLHVLPVPTPAILFSGSVLSTSVAYSSYQWYKDSVAITGATNATYTAADTGSFSVEVTDSAGCSGMATVYNVFSLAAPGSSQAAMVNIYPNPAHSVLCIASAIKVNATITAIDGRVLLEMDDAKQLDLSSLTNGIYLISIYDSQTRLKIKTDRIIKIAE